MKETKNFNVFTVQRMNISKLFIFYRGVCVLQSMNRFSLFNDTIFVDDAAYYSLVVYLSVS